MMNASAALYVKEGESLSIVNELSVELQREKQRNVELMEKVSMLESQLQDQNKARTENVRREIRKFKKQKVDNISNSELRQTTEENNVEDKLVSWMSMDESQIPNLERRKSSNIVLDSKEMSLLRSEEMTASASGQRRHRKMAFCPKEVRRILEMEELSKRNAESHTIRKIIVFSSLGIRHGCHDMYELDLNHFSISQEHVVYENPGVRKKIFYQNRQNPTLCPVQILEEEKTMRPSDATCPSCLFLCIKYGGSTRNLPQNEYVRQRMGRNKLKSFGPLICRMSMLINVRFGSFFFKAIGITLLFMACFPNDLVQSETKYRNLDLIQKYYRTDEDAEGEELFLSHTTKNDSNPKTVQMSACSKPKSKRKTSVSDNLNTKTSVVKSTPAVTSNNVVNNPSSNITLNPFLPAYPTSSFVPMLYWPFQTCPYPSTYRYPPPGNYLTVQPNPYYNYPLNSNFQGSVRNDNAVSEVAERDSNSFSSSKESRKNVIFQYKS